MDVPRCIRFLPIVCGIAVAPPAVASQQVVELDFSDRTISLDGYEELWRLGGLTPRQWEAFGAVGSIAFLPDGGLVVHDKQGPRVVVVNPKGELVKEIATRGEGPGELKFVHSVLVSQDEGGFFIYDRVKLEFMLYSDAGEYVRSVTLPHDVRQSLEHLRAWTSPDLVPSTKANEVFRIVPTSSGGSREIERIMLDGRRVKAEPFHRAWRSAAQRLPENDVLTYNPGEEVLVEAFFPELRLSPLPEGGLLVVDSSAYELKIISGDGGLSHVWRRSIPPLPVTEREKRSAQAARRRLAEEGRVPSMQDMYHAFIRGIDNMKVFPELSVISEVRTGWDGQVWVQRRHESDRSWENGEPQNGCGPIDVISGSGTYLGTLGPDEFCMPDALGPQGLVAFVESSEMGVETVVVGRLPATLSPPSLHSR